MVSGCASIAGSCFCRNLFCVTNFLSSFPSFFIFFVLQLVCDLFCFISCFSMLEHSSLLWNACFWAPAFFFHESFFAFLFAVLSRHTIMFLHLRNCFPFPRQGKLSTHEGFHFCFDAGWASSILSNGHRLLTWGFCTFRNTGLFSAVCQYFPTLPIYRSPLSSVGPTTAPPAGRRAHRSRHGTSAAIFGRLNSRLASSAEGS